MAKITLADNLKLTPQVPVPDQSVTTPTTSRRGGPAARASTPKSSGSAPTRSAHRFDDYEPITARLSQDQVDDLDRLAKRLERAKPTGLPRITRNTLVRVAVDVLLANAQSLAGPDEDSLRAALLNTTIAPTED